jgi:hypothetical protein
MTEPQWLTEVGVTYAHLDESSTADGTARDAPPGSVECRYLWLSLREGVAECHGTGRLAILEQHGLITRAAFLNLLIHWNLGLDHPRRSSVYAPLAVALTTSTLAADAAAQPLAPRRSPAARRLHGKATESNPQVRRRQVSLTGRAHHRILR